MAAQNGPPQAGGLRAGPARPAWPGPAREEKEGGGGREGKGIIYNITLHNIT